MTRNRKCSIQTLSLVSVLLTQPRTWRHGYELSRVSMLKAGTLYPILMRLSDRGLLESKWQGAGQAGRPPRHLYRLTAKGMAFAEEQIAGSRPAMPGLKLQGSRA